MALCTLWAIHKRQYHQPEYAARPCAPRSGKVIDHVLNAQCADTRLLESTGTRKNLDLVSLHEDIQEHVSLVKPSACGSKAGKPSFSNPFYLSIPALSYSPIIEMTCSPVPSRSCSVNPTPPPLTDRRCRSRRLAAAGTPYIAVYCSLLKFGRGTLTSTIMAPTTLGYEFTLRLRARPWNNGRLRSRTLSICSVEVLQLVNDCSAWKRFE